MISATVRSPPWPSTRSAASKPVRRGPMWTETMWHVAVAINSLSGFEAGALMLSDSEAESRADVVPSHGPMWSRIMPRC